MTTYRVEISPAVDRDLRRIPKADKKRILDKIEALSYNPLPRGVKKLVEGDVSYRLRVGDFRIIYEMYNKELVITVVRVVHRSKAY